MFVAVSPLAESSNTYVSTDASALLAGSSMLLLLTLRWRRTGAKVGAFAVLGMLLTLLKVQNIAAVGFAALFLLVVGVVRSFRRSRRDGGFLGRVIRDRDVLTAVATVVASVAAQAIWLVIRSQLSLDGSPDQGVGTRLSGTALLAESFRFLPSMSGFPCRSRWMRRSPSSRASAPVGRGRRPRTPLRGASREQARDVRRIAAHGDCGPRPAPGPPECRDRRLLLHPSIAIRHVARPDLLRGALPADLAQALAGLAFIAAGIASFAVTCAAGIGS